jgi:hypothetical protein
MRAASIGFVLIYIDEAHSTLWPVGLPDTPFPQRNQQDRLDRARAFAAAHSASQEAFQIVSDCEHDTFAETFRAWPDKYLCMNSDLNVIAMSSYGAYADALVDQDCLDLLESMC